MLTCGLLTLVLAGAAATWLRADDAEIDEVKATQVKAAYLYNFIKFTRWPKDAFDKQDDPIHVAVMGHSKLADVFTRAVGGRSAHGRMIQVKRVRHPDPPVGMDAMDPDRVRQYERQRQQMYAMLRDCHCLYVAPDNAQHARALIGALGRSPVLLTSDIPEFARWGGHVDMTPDEQQKKIVFSINRESLKTSDLQISSQILRLARLVSTEEP